MSVRSNCKYAPQKKKSGGKRDPVACCHSRGEEVPRQPKGEKPANAGPKGGEGREVPLRGKKMYHKRGGKMVKMGLGERKKEAFMPKRKKERLQHSNITWFGGGGWRKRLKWYFS